MQGFRLKCASCRVTIQGQIEPYYNPLHPDKEGIAVAIRACPVCKTTEKDCLNVMWFEIASEA